MHIFLCMLAHFSVQMVMKHRCGNEMRKALIREMTPREAAGDYGQVWICDVCGVKVMCYA